MRYLGSKRRIIKELIPFLLKDEKNMDYYIEPFVGGCNSIIEVKKVSKLKCIGIDNNPYLILFLNELKKGWKPPKKVSENLYQELRIEQKNKTFDEVNDPVLTAYVGLLMSFSAKWFGGYRRSSDRDEHKIAYQQAINLSKNISDIDFIFASYNEYPIPDSSIIYCDPPYKKVTTGYYNKNFNHEEFYKWCMKIKNSDNRLFLSSYTAPKEFTCLWSKKVRTMVEVKKYKNNIEKLYELK